MRRAIVVAVVFALGGVAWLLRPVDRSPDPVVTTLPLPGAEPQKAAPPVPDLSSRPPRSSPRSMAAERTNVCRRSSSTPASQLSRRKSWMTCSGAATSITRTRRANTSGTPSCADARYRLTAENLARGMADADAMEKSWMSSPPHRENILNPRYRLTGIAVSQNPLTAVVLFADTCG